MVWKLDRLSRSLRDGIATTERLGESGAGFRSLTEAIDTPTPAGRMMMQMVGASAEFERAMRKERTKAGLDAASSAVRRGPAGRRLAAAFRGSGAGAERGDPAGILDRDAQRTARDSLPSHGSCHPSQNS